METKKIKCGRRSLNNGPKERFFNPVWQNKAHISALCSALSGEYDGGYFSYIVFSERCALKNVSVYSPNVNVLKRNCLRDVLKKDMASRKAVLSNEQTDRIYEKLLGCCHAGEEIKRKHIDDIKARITH